MDRDMFARVIICFKFLAARQKAVRGLWGKMVSHSCWKKAFHMFLMSWDHLAMSGEYFTMIGSSGRSI